MASHGLKMRFGSTTFLVSLSLLLAFVLGILLFLYLGASSHAEQLAVENRRLKRELLNTHNDKNKGVYKLNLVRDDLEEAVRVKKLIEDDITAKNNEMTEIQAKFVSHVQFCLVCE